MTLRPSATAEFQRHHLGTWAEAISDGYGASGWDHLGLTMSYLSKNWGCRVIAANCCLFCGIFRFDNVMGELSTGIKHIGSVLGLVVHVRMVCANFVLYTLIFHSISMSIYIHMIFHASAAADSNLHRCDVAPMFWSLFCGKIHRWLGHVEDRAS